MKIGLLNLELLFPIDVVLISIVSVKYKENVFEVDPDPRGG